MQVESTPTGFSNRFFSSFSTIGDAESDSDDVRIQKRILVGISSMVGTAAVVWGLIYLSFGEPAAASIPLSYAVASALSLTIFAKNARYSLYRVSQLALILVLPFGLFVVLGGFANSSAVILWSLLAPLGSMFMDGRRQGLKWFSAFVLLVVVAGLLTPIYPDANNLGTATIVTFFVMNIVGVSTAAFTLVSYFVGQREMAFRLLDQEQQKSERLLLNVLPREIADQLKENQETIAQRFDSMSVLFADIVGFTPLSSRMEPEAMVDLLNLVFRDFDELTEKYGLEKIRTIGDSYMVASGVPTTRPDHAPAIALMALEMMGHVEDSSSTFGQPLQFRIGINSGPVVAGIIGESKFQYDIWGDTVNIASRMESHGVAGKIQITETTFRLLEGAFVCEERGVIDVKGKGPMPTWFLQGVAS